LPITDANATIFIGGISMGQSYRDLIAWQKAMALVTDVYLATRRFPGEERYGLTNQPRRPAVLIPRTIAEGQARFSAGEFFHFLKHGAWLACGSGNARSDCR